MSAPSEAYIFQGVKISPRQGLAIRRELNSAFSKATN